jgi:hypothetical protein
MAAPRSPAPARSAETTAGSAPASHTAAAGTSARQPAGPVGATGGTDGLLPPASAGNGSLVNPTAAAGTPARRPAGPAAATGGADRLLPPASAGNGSLVNPAAARAVGGPLAAVSTTAAATPTGAGVTLAAVPAQAEWVRRGADRGNAKTATAAPQNPAPRGHAHHRVAPAGRTRDKGSGATADSAAYADAGGTSSRRPDDAFGAPGTAHRRLSRASS